MPRGPKLPGSRDARFWAKARQTKFRSRTTIVDGISFASRKEAKRYSQLKLLEHAGAISGLRLQVPYPIVVNGVEVCKYVADFVYVRDGAEVVEDTKSEYTAKLPLYRLKKKLVQAVHGIEIVES